MLFSLRYRPDTKTLAIYRKDMKDREYAGSAKADIPSGAWTHVACTFEPGAEAVVYLNGRRTLAVPLPAREGVLRAQRLSGAHAAFAVAA